MAWQTVSNGAHSASAQDCLIDRFHTLVAHSSCWLHTSFGVLSGSITGDYSTRLTQREGGRVGRWWGGAEREREREKKSQKM